MKKFNIALVGGITLGMSMLLSGGAYADTANVTVFGNIPGGLSSGAYALSTNSISNFGIGFSNLSTFFTFSFNGNTAAINGISQSNGGVLDAAASCVNCAHTNSFTPHSASASSYAYGDSQILSDNVTAGLGAAKAIGEVYLSGSTAETAYAHGVNTMSGSIFVPTSTVMSFNFFAAPNLEATLSSGGLWAAANMAMTVTLTQGSSTIFSWAPNGAIGGVYGGTDTLDPFSLNTSLARLTNGTSSIIPGTGQFQAATNVLGAGLYSLNITMTNTAQAQTVPVPAAVWLLGSGLIGLIGVARRRHSNTV